MSREPTWSCWISLTGNSDDKTSPRASELAEKAAKTPNVDVADSGRDSRHDASTRTVPELNVKKTPVSAWARGPPRFGKPLRSADGLSAFAAPYSSKPLAVDPKGEVVDASLVPPPPVIVSAAKAQSVWNRGPPHCAPKTPASKPRVHHITIVPADEVDAGAQEVEMPIPTPSHAHLMPPISAWTVNSTDSDPAAPWDPAILARGPRPDTETDVGMAYVPTYPWGVPMHPAVPSYPDQHGLMYLPKDHDVLWTPKGWAVQDAGMKRAMSFAEMNSGKPHRNRRAGKNYYRSGSGLNCLFRGSLMHRAALQVLRSRRLSAWRQMHLVSCYNPQDNADLSAFTSCQRLIRIRLCLRRTRRGKM